MKILEIDLYTNDLAGTYAFYSHELSVPIIAQSAHHLTFQIGWTRLTFKAVNQSVAPYHFAINVPYSMLEECTYFFAFDYLDTQAPGQIIAEFPAWHARACYFYDNNGNLIKFIGRADLPLDNPNLTISDLFQGVSEISMATPDVAQTTRQLTLQFGVRQHTNSTPSPNFNALGDNSGLFVLSRLDSKWPFTDVSTQLSYVRIAFLNEPISQPQVLNSRDLFQLLAKKVTHIQLN